MKIFRVCVTLAALMMVCAGCAGGSTKRISNTASPAATIKTPNPTETAGIVSPTPSGMATAIASPPAEPTITETHVTDYQGLFNEENFTEYFQFGMSHEEAKKKLQELRYEIYEEGYSDEKDGFYDIQTTGALFSFNAKNQLFSIIVYGWSTAKGLHEKDSIDRMHLLYGKEDGYDAFQNEYIYNKKGYMLSIFADPIEHNIMGGGWEVYVNIWNCPGFSVPTESGGMAKQLKGDDSIQFNESNFTRYFHLGMNGQDIIKKLTDLGIRISWVDQTTYGDKVSWVISTDHVMFSTDTHDHLHQIIVRGWSTGKGLQMGDSVNKLHQLYGKESKMDNESVDQTVMQEYSYERKGYTILFSFYCFLPDVTVKLDSWEIIAN